MRKIRVLVVDDSIMFRELLSKGISQDPEIEVVATASDPFEARDLILEHEPDVMTLDVELPKMNGIDFLRRLMPQYPLPTVVVSSLNMKVFDALEAGAVDFVNKPSGLRRDQIQQFIEDELIAKIKIAASVKVGRSNRSNISANRSVVSASSSMQSNRDFGGDKIVAIGASTGGTEAIYNVVKNFGTDIPGVVIVQHMPPGFTAMYAQRLNNQCKVSVKEAQTGDKVERGTVLIAPGDAHMRLVKINGVYQVECKKGEKVSGHCPSVDVLFDSVSRIAKNKAVGVILTGMGADGAKGLLAMRNAGAQTIGQDEASSVVYGMPKVAYDIGAVKYQVSLANISGKVYNVLNDM